MSGFSRTFGLRFGVIMVVFLIIGVLSIFDLFVLEDAAVEMPPLD